MQKPQEDKTPPANVSELKAVAGVGKVTLSWTNPNDEDLYQVEITATSEGGIVPDPTYQMAARGKTDSATISGLSADNDYVFTVKTLDKKGNKSSGVKTEKIRVKSLSPMSITLSQMPAKETWTNGNVTITVTSSTSVKVAKWASGVKAAKEVMESGTAISNGKFEVSENGSYSVAVQDNEGRQEVETIKVENIDKTPPNAPQNFQAGYSASKKTITLKWESVSDAESGVKELKLEYTKAGTAQTSVPIAGDKTTHILENIEVDGSVYEFTLSVIDNAGNTGAGSSCSITPKIAPEVLSVKSDRAKVWYKGDRKVTLTISGANLKKASEIKITGGVTPVICSISSDETISCEVEIPEETEYYTLQVWMTESGGMPAMQTATAIVTCTKPKAESLTATKSDGTASRHKRIISQHKNKRLRKL